MHFMSYIIALVVGLLIDAIWLGLVAKNFYATNIGHLMAPQPNWYAAGFFYLLFIAGVTYFITAPALQSNTSLVAVAVSGALLGLVAYGTYDLTNQATLRDWPWMVTMIDLAWGAFLTASISVITVWLMRWYN